MERRRLKVLLGALDALIDEYSKIDPDLNFQLYMQLESKIKGNEFDSPFEFDDDFPKDATWLKQILHLLDKHDRFLSNSEMAELLLPYYPEKNVDGLKRRVSVVISDAYKSNKVRGLFKTKVSSSPQGFVWGYLKWLDSKGNIRQRHKPFVHAKSPTW